jgi:hypothetical protein
LRFAALFAIRERFDSRTTRDARTTRASQSICDSQTICDSRFADDLRFANDSRFVLGDLPLNTSDFEGAVVITWAEARVNKAEKRVTALEHELAIGVAAIRRAL